MKHFIRFFSLSVTLLLMSWGVSAQSSPVIMTSPTELDFSTTIGLPVTKEVNVKIAGLPSLAVLSSFNAVVQGQDADQFSVEMPSLSLVGILQALLGQGIDIRVTYNPFAVSSQHQAELLIETALLGLLVPVQTTLPLRGESFEPPVVESTNPVNGAQGVAVNRRNIRISYDKDIAVQNPSGITINGTPVTSYSVDRGVLTINTFGLFTSSTAYTVNIAAGAITANGGYSTTVEDFSFSFTTEYVAPTYTITPAPGSTIYLDSPVDRFTINVRFSAPVTIQQTIVDTSEGYYGTLRQDSSDRNLVIIECGSLNQVGQVPPSNISLMIPAGAIADAMTGTPLEAINVGTYQVFAGPYVTNVNPVADPNDPIVIPTDNFEITITFTFNRTIQKLGNAAPATLTSDFPGVSISSYRIEGNQLFIVITGTERSFNNFTLTLQENTIANQEGDFLIGNMAGSYRFAIERANNARSSVKGGSTVNMALSGVISASYYTIRGMQVNKTDLQPGQIYIKKTTYEDGSVDSQKFVYQQGF